MPLLEETLEPLNKSILVTKSLEDLLDEHLTPTEKEKISGLISDKLISPDSSADLADLSDRGTVPELPHEEVPDFPSREAEFESENEIIEESNKSEEPLNQLEGSEQEGEETLNPLEGSDHEESRREEEILNQLEGIEHEKEVQELLNQLEGSGPEDRRREEEVQEILNQLESSGRDGDLTESDEVSSDSPDTVVEESSPREQSSPEQSKEEANSFEMTNSESIYWS